MASKTDRMRTMLPGCRIALLGIFMVALPTVALATNNCAWINEATVSGLLGGDAVGEVTAAEGQPTVCMFTEMDAGVKHTLRLTVEISTDAHARVSAIAQSCGADATPLKAIGNEALACAADDRKAGMGELVVGRVRDQVFTITIVTSLKNDPVLKRDALKSRIYTAAEQVAGNLF
jgi:hypothetical protein